MNGHSELELDALRNIKPMKLGVKEMCQAAVELVCSTDDSGTPQCTNRKPIYDFLLVINTNFPPILHRFQVMADYLKFSLATGVRFTLAPSLGAIPCEYRHK